MEARDVPLAGTPGRVAIEELRPREGHDEEWLVSGPLEDRPDERDQAVVGPLQVLEDENRRAPLGDPFEEASARRRTARPVGRQVVPRAPGAPAGGAGSSVPPPGPATNSLTDAASLSAVEAASSARRCPPDVGPSRRAPRRPTLAVGRRPAVMPVHRFDDAVEVLLELPCQAALADPGDTRDRHADAPAGPRAVAWSRSLIARIRLRDRRTAARGVGAAGATDRRRPHGAPRRDRGLLTLQRLLADRFKRDRARRRPHSRLPDEDGPRRCDRLQARRGVHDVAGDHALARSADVTAASPVWTAARSWSSGTGRSDPGAAPCNQVNARPDGTLGIVLVGRRCAPDGHDGIADELLDGAAVPLDDLARGCEIPLEQLARLLAVEPLRPRRVAHEIGEQHRHEAPLRDGLGAAKRWPRPRVGRTWLRV